MKNKITTIIITILGLTLILIGIFLIKIKSPKKNNNHNTHQNEITNNMSKVSSYNIGIYMKKEEKEISTTGSIKKTKGFNYFRGIIDLDPEVEQPNGQTDMEYIFDLVEQRYKQNIYYKNNLLASNIYDNIGNNRNIDLIDSTNILLYFGELLSDEMTTCKKNTCNLNLSEVQIDRLLLLITTIVNKTIYSSLENQENVEAIFEIDNKEKKIQEVTLITTEKSTINIKFTSLKF